VNKQKAWTRYKDDELLKQIGGKIREERTALNMSIENLANECEVDYSQINRMELGKVNFNISSLNKVAKVLRVSLKDLLP
jgi:transcriptional regulator with XRE-family HTH domain